MISTKDIEIFAEKSKFSKDWFLESCNFFLLFPIITKNLKITPNVRATKIASFFE